MGRDRFRREELSNDFRVVGNRLVFPPKINDRAHRGLMHVLGTTALRAFDEITLDFHGCTHAYPAGMVPIICSLSAFARRGARYKLQLPKNPHLARLFKATNWAHFLSPDNYRPSDTVHDRHLAVQQFVAPEEQQAVVNDFLDVVMRTMEVPRNVLAGLEWSINEITDNVLNHANSPEGGFVQLVTYHDNQLVAVTVADLGRGILAAMREGFPTLRTDEQAIGEAIKEGVTSRQNYGQGNGLAGTLRIATMSGGSFEVMSGLGKLLVKKGSEDDLATSSYRRAPSQRYEGTVISMQLPVNPEFQVADALVFQGKRYEPADVIETSYEHHSEQLLVLNMRNETTGFGSRHSGAQVRQKVRNLLNADPTKQLVVEWDGVPVISSSFADEAMGKLFVELGPLGFSARVRNQGMEPLVRALLDKAISQRLVQSMAKA